MNDSGDPLRGLDEGVAGEEPNGTLSVRR
jgi:hypothetical protein